MKSCPNCGADLPDDARFCMQCGTPQEGDARPSAQMEGDGAIAQGDHAATVGAGALSITGTVHGNVYHGPTTTDPAEALRIYRQVLIASCCHLPLRGVDLEASDPTVAQQHFDLADVYVDLDTKRRIPADTPLPEALDDSPRKEWRKLCYLSALDAVIHIPRLVLLGEPGSGKSTFLNYLGLSLADPGQEREQRLTAWPSEETRAVPILLTLRDFARWLPDDVGPAAPRHLWDFLTSRLKAQNLEFVADPLHQILESGRAVVLLDGLDEIPTKGKRVFVRDAVRVFAERYPRSRMLVTCRVLSYQNPAWQLPDFPDVELASFDTEKIDRFIGAWYEELTRLGTVRAEDTQGLADRLREAVRRPDLWRLAPNPLLLTVMALVHTHKGRLPDARALLYEDTVDILLWRWEQIKAGGKDNVPRLRRLLQEAERTDVDLKRVLWRLAFEAHAQGGFGNDEDLADIGELRLEKALATLHPDNSRDWAQKVTWAMKLRAGLLLEREPEVYTFPHRTFQEYLAGAHLSAQADFSQRAATLVEDGAFWREVILLAVGRLVYLSGDTDKPLALVGELCPKEPADNTSAWQKVWLAGDILLELGLNRVREGHLGRDLLERAQCRLVDLLRGGHLEPVERAEAGKTLSRLGDPRFRANALYLPDEPLLGFVEIPEGAFLMGEGKDQHELTLPMYYMARYPVTVAQFCAFVEASGYEPRDRDSLRGVDTHPVVWVSWREALAYCEWLTETLQTWESTPEPLATLLREKSWVVTLPSEAEWEKAARSSDGRRYPWGEDPDPNRANYNETGIDATSAVGCFPGGKSPYGVEELSGNVWEWTRSHLKGYPYNPADGRENLDAGNDIRRVVRGGAFDHYSRRVRCAFRYDGYPYGRLRNYGFRVVVSSFSRTE